jgi:nitrite reductase (NADH) small subunit
MSAGAVSVNAAAANWIAVGVLDDIPRLGARRVMWGETSIGVFRTADDKVYALEDKCPHRDGPLSQGIVHDSCVTCPLHNWVICLETGEAQGADEGAVRVFRVKIDAAGAVLLCADDLKPRRADSGAADNAAEAR